MAMNRQYRRMAQRSGEVDADGAPIAQRRQQPNQRQREDRATPAEFMREVRGELRKVAWPSRSEVISYSTIVFVLVVALTLFIAGLDWGFGEAILKLFER